MWSIGVEVEQGTSAPPPKKNPGSAPDHECEHHPCSWGFSRQSQYLRKEVAREKVARVNEMITLYLGKMLPSLSANSLQL